MERASEGVRGAHRGAYTVPRACVTPRGKRMQCPRGRTRCARRDARTAVPRHTHTSSLDMQAAAHWVRVSVLVHDNTLGVGGALGACSAP